MAHNCFPVLPGATIGVLGSGQLGRMFALAARRMGYRIHTFSPDSDSPTGQVADKEMSASYNDLEALRKFAKEIDIVTFEFENVPFASVKAVAEIVPVRPAGEVLHITQNRLREKTFLAQNGFPVTKFLPAQSRAEVQQAIQTLGVPAVLKTAGFGYDGKGQRVIRSAADVPSDNEFRSLGECIVEAFVPFQREVSIVAARGADGAYADWGVIDNTHVHHILDVSLAPAEVPEHVRKRAQELARGILQTLNVVGVMCVECFLLDDESLLVNELAPRPHNSGHLTIDACVTSQFEQQVRTVCGLPLGDTSYRNAAAMVNLLGDEWKNGEPKWTAAYALPDVQVHLYGKSKPLPGRKMGHITALGLNISEARELALRARRALTQTSA